MNIVILNSTPKCLATKSIVRAGTKRANQMPVLDPAYLSPYISSVGGYDRLYDMIAGPDKRLAIKNIDVIIPRFATNVRFNTFVLDHLTNNMGIPSVQSAQGIRIAANKWHTLQVCSQYGIRVPKTIYSSTLKDPEYLIKKIGPLPLLIKSNYGSMGTSLMIIETKKTAISAIQTLIKTKNDFIIQEYIPSDASDVRIVIVGSKIICSYLRRAEKGEWRSNLSLGAVGTPITITPEEEIMALKAASAVGLEVCGVDIIRDKKGVPFLLEVNSNMGFKGEKITGVNFGQKIVEFAEVKAKNNSSNSKDLKQLHDEVYKSHFRRIDKKLKFFLENPSINQTLEKSRGKVISYRDLTGQKHRLKVESVGDIYKMIFDTFKIT